MAQPGHSATTLDGRRWTLSRSHPMTTSFDGPRLRLGESVEVAPAAELHQVHLNYHHMVEVAQGYREALEYIAANCGDDSRPEDNAAQIASAALDERQAKP